MKVYSTPLLIHNVCTNHLTDLLIDKLLKLLVRLNNNLYLAFSMHELLELVLWWRDEIDYF